MQGRKTGGRQAGTPNRITRELRETLKGVIALELDRVQDSLASLTPKERLDVLIRLMPYAMPRVDTINGKYDLSWSDDTF